MRNDRKPWRHGVGVDTRTPNTATCMPSNYFTEMCSGSEASSYLRLIDFVYDSNLGLREIQKKKRRTWETAWWDAIAAS